jgi:hypothetical protein
MSGVAGYKAQLKIGGTPTVFTDEPLLELSEFVYRITNPIKRVLSANHEVVIEDDNNDIITPLAINYLEGVILLADPGFVLPIRISGRYIPLSFVGGSKEYTLEIAGEILDDSAFHSDTEISSGYRSKVQGIHDVSCSFVRWNDLSNNKLKEAKLSKTPIFVSINPGASKTFIKGWFQIETDSLSGDIGSLEQEDLSLVLCGNNTKTYFSYSFNYTDIEAQALTENDLKNNWFPEYYVS